MNFKEIYYPETKFGGFCDIDGVIIFYARVNSLLNNSDVVLDIGCGRGAYINDQVRFRKGLRIVKGKCQKVIGIDVHQAAKDNPFIDEFRLIEQPTWPIEDESIDLAVCDAVLEHIENPEDFFHELRRVLKPGGFACLKTINKYGYISMISRLIPEKYHQSILNRAQPHRKEEDIFKTYYRVNTVGQLRKYFTKYGFDNCIYTFEAEPSYFAFSRFLYWLGIQYQKYAPKMFRNALFAFGQKMVSK